MIRQTCIGEKCFNFKDGKCYVYKNQQPISVKEGSECVIVEWAD